MVAALGSTPMGHGIGVVETVPIVVGVFAVGFLNEDRFPSRDFGALNMLNQTRHDQAPNR
jgi:hypothetical protein